MFRTQPPVTAIQAQFVFSGGTGHNIPPETQQRCYYALSYPHTPPSSGTQGQHYINETFCQGDPLNTLLKEKLAHSESPSDSTDNTLITHKFYMNLSIVATYKTACLKRGGASPTKGSDSCANF